MEPPAIPEQSIEPEPQIQDNTMAAVVHDHLISKPFTSVSITDLGSLDRLPLELLCQICLEIDVRSIFELRQVNRRSRQVVDSLKEYQNRLLEHLNDFTALLRSPLGSNISLLAFDNLIRTEQCRLCGKYGGYVSLPSWIQCCLECVWQTPEIPKDALSTVQKQLLTSIDEAARCRSILRTLPGDPTTYENHDRLANGMEFILMVI
ncbi:MAG: hypothetical protein Q9160_008098 [Pyrenula sp. 1 TL-2023]